MLISSYFVQRTPTQRRIGDASPSYLVSGLDEMAQLVNHRYEDWVKEQQVRLSAEPLFFTRTALRTTLERRC